MLKRSSLSLLLALLMAGIPLVASAAECQGVKMEDLKEGDTLMFSYTPGKGTNVEINGKSKAIIMGDDFASALLSIWLGNPPNDEIKRGLLGGKC